MELIKIKTTEEQSGIDGNIKINKDSVVKTECDFDVNEKTIKVHWRLIVDDNIGSIAYIKTHSFYEIKNKEIKKTDSLLIGVIESTYSEFYERCKREYIMASNRVLPSSCLSNDSIQQLLLRLRKSFSPT